jgi:tripartite-type tricarboxylate transporter receptor subunit TctC
MKINTTFIVLLLTIFANLVSAQDKTADSYPSKPIRFIVPYAPGGPTDMLARLLGQKFTERWGQPVVGDNRAGANGAIGAEMLAKSPADGSVLFLGNTSILTIMRPEVMKPEVDTQAGAVSRLSWLIADQTDVRSEVEINPLYAGPGFCGVLAVDAVARCT